jgi:hypothetical protein
MSAATRPHEEEENEVNDWFVGEVLGNIEERAGTLYRVKVSGIDDESVKELFGGVDEEGFAEVYWPEESKVTLHQVTAGTGVSESGEVLLSAVDEEGVAEVYLSAENASCSQST